MIDSSILSPAVRIERLVTMPPKEITATSVVPPPISTIILPVGSHTGNPDPIAAAKGSAIGNASLAPACLVASMTARSSTIVMPDGTQTITLGFLANNERFFIALLILYFIIVAVVSYSAITPSFIGLITDIFPGVRPIMFFA